MKRLAGFRQRQIFDMHRFCFLALCIALCVDLGMLCAKELPGEDTLPGQVRAPNKKLPPESALPGQSLRRAPTGRRWPGENELPGIQVSQKQSPVVAEPLLDDDAGIQSPSDTQPEPMPAPAVLGQAPATFPWLRLNMDGHTGTVRVMTFSRDGARLFSGGDDKALEIWNRVEGGVDRTRWMHERTIRWQVHRGPRGRIQAIASNADTVAIAGYGAMSEMGEILMIDPVTGALKRSLYDAQIGHRQPIVSMSFAPNAPILVSQDISGKALLWMPNADTGIWTPRQLAASDREQYGEQTTAVLEPLRRLAPLVMLGDRSVVLPVYHKQLPASEVHPKGVASWHLQRMELPSLKRSNLNASVSQMDHLGMVTSLAASPDGKRLASADVYGNLFFWDLEGAVRGKKVPQDVAITSMSFTSSGRRLLVGCGESRRRGGNAAVHVWATDVTTAPALAADKPVAQSADSVAISPRGDWIAFSQGTQIVIQRASEFTGQAGNMLAGRARPVLRVAFAAQEPLYRVAFGTRPKADGRVGLERSFDLENVQLQAEPALQETDWLSPTAARGEWQLVLPEAGKDPWHWLSYRNQKTARLPIRTELHGIASATCWIAGANNQPAAVAVGTSRQNLILVFQLPAKGEAKLLRQFRGHEGTVRSISVSRDGRYLVSSADDATIRVWNLSGYATDSETVNRWGADFVVQDGELVVQAVREEGPLYFRGVRNGDTITSLGWFDGKQRVETDVPGEMLAVLSGESGKENIAIYFRRGEVVQQAFHQYAAWQPLASVFVAENREWAFWTPAGYYDASFDGHKLFGWQVNPETLERLPEFFLAAQFQPALERPQVMAQLLRAGSLEAAFRAVRQLPPAKAEDAVLDQYRLKPRVQIHSPQPNVTVSNSRTKIEATISVRDGLQLTPPKAFANGVVASNRRLVREEAVPGGREFHYEWDAQFPSDPRVVVQVVASTDAAVVDSQSVVVQHQPSPKQRHPKLYIVAAGVNRYQDAQIQRLDYAVSNARSVVDLLRGNSKSLYRSEATMLLDNQATRPMWSVITRESAEQLRDEAQADDLLVFFLSGHGVRDEETQKYYFVAADARFDDVKARRFGNCLSFDDFAAFAEVPCRKLVVLDTCHSGAVQQPLRQQDLKAALRALQTDVVFTMTASEGSQEASEQKEKRLGRFTARLLEALSGLADEKSRGGDGDKIVTLNEAFRYVSAAVPADSKADEQVQHPTAGPIDLLDYAVLPLTASP